MPVIRLSPYVLAIDNACSVSCRARAGSLPARRRYAACAALVSAWCSNAPVRSSRSKAASKRSSGEPAPSRASKRARYRSALPNAATKCPASRLMPAYSAMSGRNRRAAGSSSSHVVASTMNTSRIGQSPESRSWSWYRSSSHSSRRRAGCSSSSSVYSASRPGAHRWVGDSWPVIRGRTRSRPPASRCTRYICTPYGPSVSSDPNESPYSTRREQVCFAASSSPAVSWRA